MSNTNEKPTDSDKKSVGNPLFNMRFNPADKEKYTEFAKKHNITLSALIRVGLKVVYRNPNFIDPIEDPYLAKLKEAQTEKVIESEKNFNEIKDELKGMKEILDTLYLVSVKQELTNSQLKKLNKQMKKLNGNSSDSSEAVFE